MMQGTIWGLEKRFPGIKNISTDELAYQMNSSNGANSVKLLDCREEEEYIVSKIPGAERIDSSAEATQLISVLESAAAQNQTIVCYCSVGYRSCVTAQKLTDLSKEHGGFDKIFNLEGSIFKWANEERALIDQHGHPTQLVHPYSAVWGKLLRAEFRKATL